MITLIYNVTPEQKDDEIRWLKEQKIYPASKEIWDWDKGAFMISLGMIVSPETAVFIKLRHKIDTQGEYRRK